MSDVVLPGTGGELSTGFMCAEFPGISDISYLAIFVATQMESNFIGDRLTNTSRPSPGRRPPPPAAAGLCKCGLALSTDRAYYHACDS